jgi:hypothetical protein
MSVNLLSQATRFDGVPADQRMLLDGLVNADWRQALIARGFGYHVDVGAFSTPIVGGGNGTVLDQDQPEFGISVASGYTLIPVRFDITVLPGLQTTDSHETEALIAVDRAAAWAGDGTVTTETAANMRSNATGNPSGVTIFSAATANITNPTLGYELARVVKLTDVQGTAATVNLNELKLNYEPKNPPFLVGPCAIYGYWGGDIAASGFANLDFIVVASSLITGLS